jgi:hypothetical protein
MIVKFINKYPNLKPAGYKKNGRDVYILEEELICIVDGHLIKIPIGFQTDFASAPRGFWNICPPVDYAYAVAAILHDFIYVTKYFDRKICDEIFLNGLKTLRVNMIKRYGMYYAVRVGGHKPWEEYDYLTIKKNRELAGFIGIANVPLFAFK